MRGRVSLFRGKDVRVQGYLSKEGGQRFELARLRLRELARRELDEERGISDGEVVEFLARGVHVTRTVLRDLRRQRELTE